MSVVFKPHTIDIYITLSQQPNQIKTGQLGSLRSVWVSGFLHPMSYFQKGIYILRLTWLPDLQRSWFVEAWHQHHMSHGFTQLGNKDHGWFDEIMYFKQVNLVWLDNFTPISVSGLLSVWLCFRLQVGIHSHHLTLGQGSAVLRWTDGISELMNEALQPIHSRQLSPAKALQPLSLHKRRMRMSLDKLD